MKEDLLFTGKCDNCGEGFEELYKEIKSIASNILPRLGTDNIPIASLDITCLACCNGQVTLYPKKDKKR